MDEDLNWDSHNHIKDNIVRIIEANYRCGK